MATQKILVKSKASTGFRRAGIAFDRAGVVLDRSKLKKEQLEAITSDPNLIVSDYESEADRGRRLYEEKKAAEKAASDAEKAAAAVEKEEAKKAAAAAEKKAAEKSAGDADKAAAEPSGKAAK
jgi:hypothetical protein